MTNMLELTHCAGDVEGVARYAIVSETTPNFGRAPADDRRVIFQDMRGAHDAPQLFREGFELVKHRSSVASFEDAEAVASIYLGEIRDLLKQRLGTEAVFMQQNWVLRADNRDYGAQALPDGKAAMTMKTGGFLHLDYDDEASESWAKRTFEAAGVDKRPAGRLLVVTAWRAISRPPQDAPLALVDRRSVSTDAYILENIVTPEISWHGFQISYNPAHRFCWWSDMQRDELLLFLQHEGGYGPGSGAPHIAFMHPACGGRGPPRESIEVRAYAFLNE